MLPDPLLRLSLTLSPVSPCQLRAGVHVLLPASRRERVQGAESLAEEPLRRAPQDRYLTH